MTLVKVVKLVKLVFLLAWLGAALNAQAVVIKPDSATASSQFSGFYDPENTRIFGGGWIHKG